MRFSRQIQQILGFSTVREKQDVSMSYEGSGEEESEDRGESSGSEKYLVEMEVLRFSAR